MDSFINLIVFSPSLRHVISLRTRPHHKAKDLVCQFRIGFFPLTDSFLVFKINNVKANTNAAMRPHHIMKAICTRTSFSHNLLRKFQGRTVGRGLALFGLALAATGAFGQVSSINSVFVQPRIVEDLPNAQLAAVTNYPTLISFSETNAGTTNTTFAINQDLWQFSADGGTNAYTFKSNDYFSVSMNVTLTGDPASPRKEAGFAFDDVGGNINGQYILDTDAGEVVAFGGNLPFYAGSLDHTFKSGDTITMGITLFLDSNDKYAIIYSADGVSSPALEFGSPATNFTLGGYFQIQGQGTPSTNSGSAVFQNITISPGLPLGIATAGADQVVVYWPASPTNYILQSATSPTSTNWTTVSGLQVVGFALPATANAAYYRLQAQTNSTVGQQ
jgi:hypothetical protein